MPKPKYPAPPPSWPNLIDLMSAHKPDEELITPKLPSGYSPTVSAGGKIGRFNFNEPPEEGGTPSKRYRFEPEAGGAWNYQLEKQYQGGRWEDAEHAPADYERYSQLYRQDPAFLTSTFDAMWGKGNPIGQRLLASIATGEPWLFAKMRLRPYDTWRQISYGEPKPEVKSGR